MLPGYAIGAKNNKYKEKSTVYQLVKTGEEQR